MVLIYMLPYAADRAIGLGCVIVGGLLWLLDDWLLERRKK